MFEHISDVICQGESIPFSKLLGENRKVEIVYARQLIMFFSYLMGVGSLAWIGDKFGKDHATVLNAVKAINNYIDTNPIKKDEIDSYGRSLGIVKKVFDLKNEMLLILEPLHAETSILEQRLINVQLLIKNLMDQIDDIKL